MTVVWVGLVVAGSLGAPTRFLLDGFVQDHTSGAFPWGTFAINMTGSMALGLLTGATLYHAFPTTPKIILGAGFCGAYTTFSTWTFETVRLLEEGAVRGVPQRRHEPADRYRRGRRRARPQQPVTTDGLTPGA